MNNLFPNTQLVKKFISLKGCDVDHPLFGKINRYGWASMKKLDEYTFSIGLK